MTTTPTTGFHDGAACVLLSRRHYRPRDALSSRNGNLLPLSAA